MTTFFQYVQTEGERVSKEKGQYVFNQGDQEDAIYFVQSGLLKAFYTSEQGKESIKSFLSANDVIGSLTALYLRQSSSFSLISLAPTVLIKLSFKAILMQAKHDIIFANELNDLLLTLALKKETREYELLCLTAEQRYAKLIESTPTLLQNVTQSDLASYLGVTPVGLSRIKKRLFTR
ncbi:Crp/Fnr family transcriptional regulator [Thalassotalea hakodatensis]|uniref:Crp/Fnr family transcriptional regulator n=1 Tax=Thalassotalea hakodatensis TaxID=3030492 RepID=UPI0025727872|nr:Crp/Fnr family transcriptional regulator [Thalassotalea hakodatensis]